MAQNTRPLVSVNIEDKENANEAPELSSRSIRPVETNHPSVYVTIDKEQAAFTSFPPGCPVLIVDATKKDERPSVIVGKVKLVSFDVSSRELFYHITPNNVTAADDDLVVAPKNQLQFAPHCTVEADIDDGSGSLTKKDAIVLTSYQLSPTSSPMYSLQEDGPSDGPLFHGIAKSGLKYRPAEDSRKQPQVEQERSTGHQKDMTRVSSTTTQVPSEPKGDESCASSTQSPVVERIVPSSTGGGPHITRGRSSDEITQDEVQCVAMPADGRASKRFKLSQVESPFHDAAITMGARGSHADETLAEVDRNAVPSRRHYSPNEADMNKQQHSGTELRHATHETQHYQGTELQHTTCEIQGMPNALPTTLATSHSSVEEADKADDDEAVTVTTFVIPHSSFLVDDVEDFFRKNTIQISSDSQCQLRLNCHRSKSTSSKVVHQYCHHFVDKGMRYMLVKKLPGNDKRLVGAIIGRGGEYKRHLELETRCTIEINAETRLPHCVIYARHEEDVLECSRLIEEALDRKRRRFA